MPKPVRTVLNVNEQDLDNLRLSGLKAKTIRENALRTEGTVLVFPYRNLDGEVNDFARRRLHKARKGKDGKMIRYTQPKGSSVRAYFPTASLAKLRRGKAPIFVTEGEKKALALSQLGLAAVGLGGVNSGVVRSELIPDLQELNYRNRLVYLVFDHDAKQKTRINVKATARRLAGKLREVGAREVYEVVLPAGRDGGKQGVDDFLVAHGEDAFHGLVNEAEPVGEKAAWEDVTLETVCLSDVQPEPIEWFWKDRIQRAKLNKVDGDPGLGKTSVVLDMLARATRGAPFPDGEPCDRCEVLFATAEDGVADTVRPRMDAMGADTSKVHLIDCARTKDDKKERSFDLSKHLGALRDLLDERRHIRVVAIDPLAAFLGRTNTNSNSEVRAALLPVARLAERYDVTFIFIDHLSKNHDKAALGGIGSVGFTGSSVSKCKHREKRQVPRFCSERLLRRHGTPGLPLPAARLLA